MFKDGKYKDQLIEALKNKFYWIENLFNDFDWGNISLVVASTLFSFLVFTQIEYSSFKTSYSNSILTTLLTVNGVFSAILITYLFTRITWTKERKQEVLNEAINNSQKITEFRRILNILTSFYQVWDNDKSTKSLIDYSPFKHIDYHDYTTRMRVDYKPEQNELLEQFTKHPDFSEGKSILYLAIVSLVKNRKAEWSYQEELYKDFEHKGTYTLEAVEPWMDCNIMDTIIYWFDKKHRWISYYNLNSHENYIKACAIRINKKYDSYPFDNRLMKDLAEETAHHLKNLYLNLKTLHQGILGLTRLICILILFSLFFGVLLPFVLLLINSKDGWFDFAVAFLASINSGLILYFVLKFYFLMSKEVKFD